MRFRTLLLAATAALPAIPYAAAQTGPTTVSTPAPASSTPGPATPSPVTPGPTTSSQEIIVVTSDPLGRSRNEVASSVAVLRGDRLVHGREATLGETLARIPGVNSDTFGGGSSRPVIRGQTAPRVKVLVDGAAQFDASEVSPDHAITGEPLLLEGVEILRGPSALLYGGSAIGGAVNLIDRRIPTAIPEGGATGAAELRFGTADHEEAGVAGLTVGGGKFALRLEAASRNTDDYDVGDWSQDTLAGSFHQSTSATLGGSWIGEAGYLGLAYTEQTSDYGLPGHGHEYEDCHPHGATLHCGGHDHDHGDHDHGEEDHDHEDHDHPAPTVDLRSRRLDVRGEWRQPFAGVERVRLRGGYTDYRHHEIESGVIATTFRNKGHDARIEVQHAPLWGGLKGVIGGELSRSDFSADGNERFVRPSRTETGALFLMESYTEGAWSLEAALRQEWQKTENVSQRGRDFTPFSISAGAGWAFAPGYKLTLSVARSERAPQVQELYADGVHLATNTYDLGTPGLDTEAALSFELGLKGDVGDTSFEVSAYRYEYDGYIYSQTLDQFEDFRLIRYAQVDANFTGIEGEVTQRLTGQLSATLFGDYVRAELDSGGDLPRIPAGRLGVRGDVALGDLSGQLEYIRVFKQDRIASFETETSGYNMVNATIAYDLPTGAVPRAQLYLRGTNLADELALNHTSFIKNAAPLRGRNVVLGLRASF